MPIINRLGDPLGEKGRGASRHMPVGAACRNRGKNAVNLRFCCFGILRHLFRGGKVEDRRPRVRHPHGIVRADLAASYGFLSHIARRAGGRSVSGDKVQVFRLKRGLLQKLPDDVRQAPIIGRRHDPDGLVGKNITLFPDAVHDRQRRLSVGLCKPRRNVLAVSCGGKV